MGYRHTQHSPLHLLIWFLMAGLVASAVIVRHTPALAITFVSMAVVLAVLAMCFRTLTVSDEGDELLLRFGPIGAWKKRVRYGHIKSAQAGRSSFLDGWGVHWVPFRGWTWNIWGRDCVELQTLQGRLRIGTNDQDGLMALLNERIERRAA